MSKDIFHSELEQAVREALYLDIRLTEAASGNRRSRRTKRLLKLVSQVRALRVELEAIEVEDMEALVESER